MDAPRAPLISVMQACTTILSLTLRQSPSLPAHDWVRVDCMIRDIDQFLEMGSSGAYSIHGSFQFPSERRQVPRPKVCGTSGELSLALTRLIFKASRLDTRQGTRHLARSFLTWMSHSRETDVSSAIPSRCVTSVSENPRITSRAGRYLQGLLRVGN
jgi:hypothetical protein